MSQNQLPIVPENPRDTASWTAYIAALNPGKVTLQDANEAERREWNRKVRTYGLNPIVRRHVARTVGAKVIAFPVRSEGRPRERRAQAGRSSARSGDSGDDGEPAPDWHWSQPYGWQGYIRSIAPGPFEQQRRIGGAR